MPSNTKHSALLASIALQVGYEHTHTQPVLLTSVPGEGKTQFSQQLAEFLEASIQEHDPGATFAVANYVMTQVSPDAVEGVGVPGKDRTSVDFLPRKRLRDLREAKYGLLTGDELSSCSRATAASFMALTQDGMAGDVQLTSRHARMFMQNPESCAANARDMSAPESNRLLHLAWEISVDEYIDYLEGGKGFMAHPKVLPKGWTTNGSVEASKKVIALFLTHNPVWASELSDAFLNAAGSLNGYAFKPEAAWASKRSWTNLVYMMAATASTLEMEVTSDSIRDSLVMHQLITGMVGEAATQAFLAFLKNCESLPDVNTVIDQPDLLVQLVKDKREGDALTVLKALNDHAVEHAIEASDTVSVDDRIDLWIQVWDVFSAVSDAGYTQLITSVVSAKNGCARLPVPISDLQQHPRAGQVFAHPTLATVQNTSSKVG